MFLATCVLALAMMGTSALAGPGAENDTPTLPKAATAYKIFRLPLSSPRTITTSEQDELAAYFGNASFGPIVSAARRFGGSEMVAVPGATAFAIVNLTEPLAPGVGAESTGIPYQRDVQSRMWFAGSESCHDWRTVTTCPPTEQEAEHLYVNFLHLVPDFVRGERIAGVRFAPVDGLVWGSFEVQPGLNWNRVSADLVANQARWVPKIRKLARNRRTKRG